jgi:pyruvate formate-lyase activating enzyme-like uncharacterized protein
MVLQNNVRRIINEVGKEYGLDHQQSHHHYIQYIEEFVLKNLYEADFDVLRIEGLGVITPGLLRAKAYLKSLEKTTNPVQDIRDKVGKQIIYIDELNSTLKKKKLYR